MSFLELLILGISLAMDAFAVSICKGLAMKKASFGAAAIAGAWFGGFQALMPVLGYFLGSAFSSYVEAVDHWIAFILLGLIGGNMLRESLSGKEEEEDASLAFGEMLLLAIATSIDALAVGVTFAFLNVNIVEAAMIIGITTFGISFAGVKLGSLLGSRFGRWAKMAGGIILIVIGLRILLQHLDILPI